MTERKPKPGFLWSILNMRCPRCRRGNMFQNNNPYKKLSLKHIFDMPTSCPVCKQIFDLEVGFWYGTGYVSYALTVLLSGITFLLWWALIGISTEDSRIFYWLTINTILIIILQPWLMRLSRAVYIYFFISYDEHYEVTPSRELHIDEH
jgi:phage FluMu protein Com